MDAEQLNATILPLIEQIRLERSKLIGPDGKRGSLEEKPEIMPASTIGPRGLALGEVLFATDRAFEDAPEPQYRISGNKFSYENLFFHIIKKVNDRRNIANH